MARSTQSRSIANRRGNGCAWSSAARELYPVNDRGCGVRTKHRSTLKQFSCAYLRTRFIARATSEEPPSIFRVSRVARCVSRVTLGFELEFQVIRYEGRMRMFWTIAIVLIVLWGVGLITSYTLGGFVHLLLVAAIIVILIRVIEWRRV